ncbi:sensor histidine kinase [Kitasatospora viridis]|uniref:sensor histidine kinase n=1 Tax=Kitasatospora viridis TaxID=281105 RepID=UPI00119DAF10|nr:histidine kinase [Kitasatospora viridis]
MTGAPAPAWAYGVFGLTLLMGLGWVVLALTHLNDPQRSDEIAKGWALLLLAFGFGLSGVFILAHRPGNGLGRLLLATGVLTAASRFVLFVLSVVRSGRATADLGMILLLLSTAGIYLTVFSVPWWFPGGRMPGRGSRACQAVLVLWAVVESYYTYAATPDFYGLRNPLLRGGWASLYSRLDSVLGNREFWIALALVLIGLLAAAGRWYRSPGAHWRQWLVLAPWLVWMAYTFVLTEVSFSGPGFFISYSVIAAGWPLAAAFGFARDRSWHLDRAARQVLTSFTLLALLIFGYFLLGLYLPRLLPGAGNTDAQAMAACALAVGILLRPTARAVSRAVERFYYGDRARPYQVARSLAEQLRRAARMAEAPSLLCRTVVDALGLPGARVSVATRGGPRELAVLGETGPGAEVFPITVEGAPIGELHAQPRSGQLLLDPQDRGVLRFLVDQSAPALASLRLTEELQSSRKQLVLAREEERKRLRHDLHDGLGPALSGLRLQIDTARSELPPDGAVARSLQAVSQNIGSAIDELRRITDGLAPADLGQGLTGALRELAGRMDGRRLHVTVRLTPDPLPPLPAAVEVALYRISGEALNNVLRHSGASSARLELRATEDEISVEATDDGEGFPSHSSSTGVGLRSMAERAEELGGSFTAANDARGAVVRAVLPRGTVS